MIVSLLLSLAPATVSQDGAEAARSQPGDGLLHVEIPDVPALLAAYPSAPLMQMLRDDAVRATVAELLGAADLEVASAVSRALSKAGMPEALAAQPLEALGGMLAQLQSLSLSVSLTGRTEEVAGGVGATLEALTRIRALAQKAREHAEANQGFPPGSVAELDVPEGWRVDPWGHPYRIQVDMESLAFNVVSLGADGESGGEGFAADLSSATPMERAAADLVAQTLDLVTTVEFTGPDSAREAWDLVSVALEAELGTRPDGRREVQVRGAPARVCELPDIPGSGHGPWMLSVEEQISMGVGRPSLARALARAQTEAGKLRSSDTVVRVAQHLSKPSGAMVASGWVELDRLDTLLSAIELALESSGVGQVQFMPLSGSGLFRMQLDGDRFVTEYAYNVSPESALARCAGAAPVPAKLWDFIPSESIGVYASSIDGRAIYDEVMRNIVEVHGEHPKALERMEREHGFSLEQDLIGNLGDGAAAYLLPLAGVISIPGIAAVVELRDAEAFQRGLDAVLQLLEEQAEGEFTVRYRPYRDQPMWSFSFGGEAGGLAGPIAITPTLAIVRNHLLISLTSTRAKKEVKRLLEGEAQERHRLFAARGAPPADAGSIAFMDWPALASGTYDGARAALTMLGGMMDPMPVDPNALPAASVFTRFFEPSVAWTRAVGPDVRLAHSESSFGPETLIALAGGVGALVLAVQDMRSAALQVEEYEVEIGVDGQAVDAETEAAVIESSAAMEWLATRLEVYRIENGSYPRALSVLAQPTQSYPKGYLDGGALPTDGWGRGLIYEGSADGKSYSLRSLGSDGVDQRGGGDDIGLQ